MMGMYRLVRDGKPVFYELLTLVEENGTLMLRLKHFHPDLKGWEEKGHTVEFPLVALADGAVHFEGMSFHPRGNDADRVPRDPEQERRRRARRNLYLHPGFLPRRSEEYQSPARRQNCVSLSSVIRCPFSRSRLISISFRPAVPARGLQRIGPPAHDDGRARRGHAVDDRAGPPRGADGLAAALAQDAGEGEVHALQRPQHAGLQRSGRIAQGLDQLVGALVALPPLADAAVDDLLQVIAAREPADLVGADPRPRVALHQHAQQLPHLVHVVARLPLRGGARRGCRSGPSSGFRCVAR